MTEFGAMAGNCAEPWPKEYTWFPADVTVDGVTIHQAGVRRKGFLGSLFLDKPALKIKTDRFVEGQFLGDTERITLNNNAGDATGLATCVAYQVFAMAGHPAPSCNVAEVRVNGGRAVFIPWGIDKTPSMAGMDPKELGESLNAEVPRRLSRVSAVADSMLAELDRLMKEVWDVEAILAGIDTLAAVVEKAGGWEKGK